MKRWITPELIVLTAGRPEEAILAACKTGHDFNGSTSGGPQSSHGICEYQSVTGVPCAACQALSPS